MDFCSIGERCQVVRVMSSRPWPRRDVASRLRHFGARARRVRLFIVIFLFHKGCLENSRFLLSPTGHWAVGDNKNLEFPSRASRLRLAHEHGSKDFPTNSYGDLCHFCRQILSHFSVFASRIDELDLGNFSMLNILL